MKVLFHQQFGKAYKKLPNHVKEQFGKRLGLFLDDPFHPLLRNHALHGEWNAFRSINITGDVRAVYHPIDHATVEFVLIGTHDTLYS